MDVFQDCYHKTEGWTERWIDRQEYRTKKKKKNFQSQQGGFNDVLINNLNGYALEGWQVCSKQM